MSFDVSGLSAYTKTNEDTLLSIAHFNAKTLGMLTPMPGVKSTEQINIQTTDAIFQAGTSCGFNASAATAYTVRTMNVGAIMVHEALCPKSLRSKWLQLKLQAGSKEDAIPFEEVYSKEKAAVIAKQLEIGAWQGDTASGNANLSRFDGLIKILDAAAGVIDATAQADITASTVRGIFQDIYTKIPTAILGMEDLVVFCGWDTFRTYQNKLATDNLYHNPGTAEQGEMYLENSGVKIVAVNGLNGTDRIFATTLSNLYYGFDMQNEEESFEIFWAKEAREVRFVAEFKAGVQVAFPDLVVSYANI